MHLNITHILFRIRCVCERPPSTQLECSEINASERWLNGYLPLGKHSLYFQSELIGIFERRSKKMQLTFLQRSDFLSYQIKLNQVDVESLQLLECSFLVVAVVRMRFFTWFVHVLHPLLFSLFWLVLFIHQHNFDASTH